MTWQERANCMGVDPAVMFPGSSDDVRPALAVCSGCEVRQECLDHAITNGERYGIWGGMTARDRWRLRQPRPLLGCGTRASYARGCRCPECRRAQSDYDARTRPRRLA